MGMNMMWAVKRPREEKQLFFSAVWMEPTLEVAKDPDLDFQAEVGIREGASPLSASPALPSPGPSSPGRPGMVLSTSRGQKTEEGPKDPGS